MITFKEFLSLPESTKDIYGAIGKTKGDALLSKPVDSKIKKMHDATFGEGNNHIEVPLHNSLPKEVHDHIESNGDSVESDTHVKLKSGRSVPISKYLGKSGASKDVVSAHQNFERNKTPDSKLIISRHPGEVASASTGTHWNSCSNLDPKKDDEHGGKGPAAMVMHHEIHHGTLIAMHVHKDAKPNEHGEYDAKDVLGRTLIKRHGSQGFFSSSTSFHPEEKTYGKFPEEAKKAVKDFTDKHYPQKGMIETKHKDLYDDDQKKTKLKDLATSEDLHKALNHKDSKVRTAALNHPKLTSEHIDTVLDHPDAAIRKEVIRHPNASSANIDKALKDKDAHIRAAAVKHPAATTAHIDKALDDKSDVVRYNAMLNPKATAAHIDKALDDKDADVRAVAITHHKATAAHITKALKDSDPGVRGEAISHPKANAEHIETALSDKDAEIRSVAEKKKAKLNNA